MTESPETLDGYLEHFGVKGMKWGVHKAHPTSGNSQTNHTPSEPKSKKEAIARGSAIAVGILAGGVFLLNRLPMNGAVRNGAKIANAILAGKVGHMKYKELHGGDTQGA